MKITENKRDATYLILPTNNERLFILTALDEALRIRIRRELASPRGEEQNARHLREFVLEPHICLTDKIFELTEFWDGEPEISDGPVYVDATHEEAAYFFQHYNISFARGARVCIEDDMLSLTCITHDHDFESLYGIVGLPGYQRGTLIRDYGIIEYVSCNIPVSFIL